MEPLATPEILTTGLEELMPSNGIEELLPSIRTYYWDPPTIKVVLLLVFAAVVYGFVNEQRVALSARRPRRS